MIKDESHEGQRTLSVIVVSIETLWGREEELRNISLNTSFRQK